MSLYSYMGWSSPTTTKIQGRIGKTNVVVLIDSGATHNFLSPEVMTKAHLQQEDMSSFKVMVGTGITVNGCGVCKGVTLQLQSVVIRSDFIVLDPGGADVVLGIQWLRTLGKCEVDWENQELSFVTSKGRVTLVGDRALHSKTSSLESITTGFELHELGTIKSEEVPVAEDMPTEIASILEHYSSVFQEPIQLPPERGFEHSIRLIDGAGAVAVHPYRYPHVISLPSCTHDGDRENGEANVGFWSDQAK